MSKNSSGKIADLLEPQIITGEIHFKKIHDLANKSFEEMKPEDRTLGWLALLHIYPVIPKQWEDCFNQVVDPYMNYVEEFKLSDWHLRRFPSLISPETISSEIDDAQQMVKINVDIMRMTRYLQFLKFCNEEENCPQEIDAMYFYHMEHVRRVERVLYIFSKTQLELGYIQGMNELAFVFYYVYSLTLSIFKGSMENVESFVYQSLVSLFQYTNIKHLYLIHDDPNSVIKALEPFSKAIEEFLPRLSQHFKELNVQPVFYSFQWFNIMFTQKHDVPEVLPIWDSLLAHLDCFLEYEFYIGIAHLSVMYGQLLSLDYGETLKLLQGKCSTPGLDILRICRKYWIKTHGILGRIAEQFKIQ